MQSVEGAVLVARCFLGSSCGYRRFGGDVMDNKLSELKAAAEKYSLTLNAHKENPKDADAVVAWDEATWEMSRLINNDEVNIIVALLAELEREIEMRAQNLEIKTLLAEKVKGLETKLWDSQQLVDAKSGSQIELRSQVSSLEERNRKDMAWRGERLCELEDSLEAAEQRIAELESDLGLKHVRAVEEALIFATDRNSELEAKLATPVRLPNEKAASAMFDIFYQTERNNGNVQLGFSDAKALGEWIAKTLELRGDGFECEVGQ